MKSYMSIVGCELRLVVALDVGADLGADESRHFEFRLWGRVGKDGDIIR